MCRQRLLTLDSTDLQGKAAVLKSIARVRGRRRNSMFIGELLEVAD